MAGFTARELLVVIALAGLLGTLKLAAISVSSRQGQELICRNNLRQLALAWLQYAEETSGALMANADGLPAAPNWVAGWLAVSPRPDNTDVQNLINPGRALMGRYLKNPAVFRCPADPSVALAAGKMTPRARSYSMNCWLGSVYGWSGTPSGWRVSRKLADLINPPPDRTFVILDEREDSINNPFFALDLLGAPHGLSPAPAALRMVDFPSYWHERGANLNFADGHVERWQWADPRTLPAVRPGGLLAQNVGSPNNPDVQRLQRAATGPVSWR